jgi:hypothetical protein
MKFPFRLPIAAAFLLAIIACAHEALAQPPGLTIAPKADVKLIDRLQKNPGLAVFGPEAETCVQFEEGALRITLPAGYPGRRGETGVVSNFGVQGDFELTASFEILSEPAAKAGARLAELSLVVKPNDAIELSRSEQDLRWNRSSQNRAAVGRAVGFGNTFVAEEGRWDRSGFFFDPGWHPNFTKVDVRTSKRAPAMSKTGRLQLSRQGAELSFLRSDGAQQNWTLLHKSQFGANDLKFVGLFATTGGPADVVDFRITDLAIRADALPLPKLTIVGPNGAALSSNPAPAPQQSRLFVFGVASAATAAIALALGLSLYFVKRRRSIPAAKRQADSANAAASAAIEFYCFSCGVRLKVKKELAGSKVKCPKCGNSIAVPNPTPNEKKPA